MFTPIANPKSSGRTFQNDDRDAALVLLRKVARGLLLAEEKDFPAIKIIYSLILDEENQDLTRRRVELSEREFESQKVQPEEKPKLLTVSEMQYRVRVLLGKELPA